MINDGTRMPRVAEAHRVSHPEGSTEHDMVFIVPRGENMLLLGGLTEEDRWSLDSFSWGCAHEVTATVEQAISRVARAA